MCATCPFFFLDPSQNMSLPRRAGFTLIELLLVIVIVGLLAGIATSVFWRARYHGFEAAMQSDLKAASVQQEHYFGRHGTYAATYGALPDYSTSPGVSIEITYAQMDGWAAVATHLSATRRCAILIGAAPATSAPPAAEPGIVQCGAP
jgi:prepilin-type N-terminal cleavage/methylation domain-containing protein